MILEWRKERQYNEKLPACYRENLYKRRRLTIAFVCGNNSWMRRPYQGRQFKDMDQEFNMKNHSLNATCTINLLQKGNAVFCVYSADFVHSHGKWVIENKIRRQYMSSLSFVKFTCKKWIQTNLTMIVQFWLQTSMVMIWLIWL